jgi:HAD superfamily hydrolase (TIGR01458 family)
LPILLDISGVLYTGDAAVPGAVGALAALRDAGEPVRCLTNTTRQPKRRIVEKLARLGFEVAPAEILTPAEAACDWLRREGYAPHLLVHPDLEEDFAGLPDTGPRAVVLGDAGRFFDYDRLNAAFRVLDGGAPFLALAANRVFRDADGALSMDAGAFVRALEYASGTEARLFGKPAPAFFAAAAASMGADLGRTTMIGDDAEADIAGARAAGVGRAILVRTGKYRPGDETRFTPPPTALARDIAEAVALVTGRAR